VNRFRAVAEPNVALQLIGSEASNLLGSGNAPPRPHFATSRSTIRIVWRQVVFVVVMIFTASSNSVLPQRRRPKPALSIHA